MTEKCSGWPGSRLPRSVVLGEDSARYFVNELNKIVDEEKIENMTALSGVYPIHLVMNEDTIWKLSQKNIRPIGDESDGQSQFVWFIPRKKEIKTTKTGKPYWILEVTDSTNTFTEIKCWSIRDTDVVHLNRPYMAQVSKDSYGVSIRNFKDHVRLLA